MYRYTNANHYKIQFTKLHVGITSNLTGAEMTHPTEIKNEYSTRNINQPSKTLCHRNNITHQIADKIKKFNNNRWNNNNNTSNNNQRIITDDK